MIFASYLLVAAAAVLVGYWYAMFRRVLPADREAASAREISAELGRALEELNATHGRLIQKSKQVKTLQDVALTLASRPGHQSTLSAVVSIVARSLQADLVAFLLLDEKTGELVAQPGAFGLEGEDLLYRIPLSSEESSSVRVFRTGEPFMAGDAQNDPRTIAKYAKLWKIHSLIVVPLKLEERCIGVMRVGSFRRDYFNQEHLELMRAVAEEAAVIVETAFLNRKLAENAEQLTALSRMKDEFVSTVSHEFKTPLTTITGFLSVVLEKEAGPLTPEQARFLTTAKNAAKRLAGLVTDLLDLSKLEGGAKMEMRTLEFEKVLAGSVENHQPVAKEAGKKLTVSVQGRLPAVRGDERWLGVVVDNLITNGLKFTRPGGKVAVTAQGKGDMLMVTVADDGIGVPPEDKEKIFEKFYRARNRGEVSAPGTGLGLTITKQVVDRHGGKIWFESEMGKGSVFHFVLPKAHEEVEA
jgi:signal transduction histidine kinase